MRVFVAAFGDPGHAFPAIALGRALAERGHSVCVQTWSRWRPNVETEGLEFAPAPEYPPLGDGPGLRPYDSAVLAARDTLPQVEAFAPDGCVVDILTIGAALAAELAGRPWATLVPHLLPTPEPGFPPYSTGARLPRTAIGGALWRALDPLALLGARLGREQLNDARRRLGLRPVARLHGGISAELALVATFPQLEYPRRRWDRSVQVVGPLLWEPPAPRPDPPEGDDPLVLVAPSTSQDPEQRLLRAALEGLAGAPVRVVAPLGDRTGSGLDVPPNATLVGWMSYAAFMPRCDVVVCHAGHGTLARALASGVPVLASPGGGDMAENAARTAWAGGGLSLPARLSSPRAVRVAVEHLLSQPRYAQRAREFADWYAWHDSGEMAARAVERWIEGRSPQRRAPSGPAHRTDGGYHGRSSFPGSSIGRANGC